MPMLTRLGGLRAADPKAWVREIAKAMKDSDGRIREAAKALGVSGRQLSRWLAEPACAHIPRVAKGVRRYDE